MDNTNKVGHKMTVTEKNKAHTKIMKGGVLSAINEKGEIISWVHTYIDHALLTLYDVPQ